MYRRLSSRRPGPSAADHSLHVRLTFCAASRHARHCCEPRPVAPAADGSLGCETAAAGWCVSPELENVQRLPFEAGHMSLSGSTALTTSWPQDISAKIANKPSARVGGEEKGYAGVSSS